MTLNVEEMILMKQMNHFARKAAVKELISLMDQTADADLKELCKRLSGKLSAMSNQEFAAVDFTVYEENANEEYA